MSEVGVSSKVVLLVGFPGEILLRMLKLLVSHLHPSHLNLKVLPLMSASIVVGISAFGKHKTAQTDAKKERKFLACMLSYFLGTTVFAVVLGLVTVSVFQVKKQVSVKNN
jgi:Na+/H+-dicarboxylate symporter